MISIAGIQLQKHGKIYYFDANNLDVHPGDFVIADTSRGYDLGEVAVGVHEVDEDTVRAPMKKLIRIATEQDISHSAENRIKEREAYGICQKKIDEHQLDMKLVSVEYAFDNSKILFYFTANGRVDFRSLVKDLASVFKMRIELRQIGVRDEAKMLGGLGPCGRPICCGAFLDEFQPVSIKMAKEQNLSLNPTKISGVCGRLMCCLKYEQDHYEQTRKRMPRIGKEVGTPNGIGTVSDLNIVKETVMVRITNGDSSEIKEFQIEQITRPDIQGNMPSRSEEPDRVTSDTLSDADSAVLISESKTFENETQENDTSASLESNNSAVGKKNRERQFQQTPNRKQNELRQTRNGHQLGKPVRRENPNKPKAEKSASPAPTEPVHDHTSATDPMPNPPRDNWAEALKKAMDAIN